MIKTNFREWTALSNCNVVTNSNITERWGYMSRQVLMALLKTVVFLHVMQVISSDDTSSKQVQGIINEN